MIETARMSDFVGFFAYEGRCTFAFARAHTALRLRWSVSHRRARPHPRQARLRYHGNTF